MGWSKNVRLLPKHLLLLIDTFVMYSFDESSNEIITKVMSLGFSLVLF